MFMLKAEEYFRQACEAENRAYPGPGPIWFFYREVERSESYQLLESALLCEEVGIAEEELRKFFGEAPNLEMICHAVNYRRKNNISLIDTIAQG